MAGKEFIPGYPMGSTHVESYKGGLIVHDIPGDDGKTTATVNYSSEGASILLTDWESLRTVPPHGALFRSYYEGGNFPHVRDELSVLGEACGKYGGQIPPHYPGRGLRDAPQNLSALR